MLRYVLTLLTLQAVTSFAPGSPLLRKQLLSDPISLPSSISIPESDMDFYAVLGASPEDSYGDLRKRYITLARRFHPDASINLDSSVSLESADVGIDFSQVNAAWTVLSDPNERLRYDRCLRTKKISDGVEGLVVGCFKMFAEPLFDMIFADNSELPKENQPVQQQHTQEVKTKKVDDYKPSDGWVRMMKRLS